MSRPAATSKPAIRPRLFFGRPLLVRPDVILGALSGFALVLVFGTPILSGLGRFWNDLVLPAFYTLAQSGLPFCG
jgi:hypothetical protein